MSYTTTENISLDLYNTTIQTVEAKQFNGLSRFVEVEVTENGVPIVLKKSEFKVYITINKADKDYDVCEAEILDNGHILIELNQNMLSEAGICQVDIMLVDANGYIDYDTPAIVLTDAYVLSTMSFYLNVRRSAARNDIVITSDNYNIFVNAMTGLIVMEKEYESNEDVRIQKEKERISSEKTRESNEKVRISNEEARKTAETSRVNVEKARVITEDSRVKAENTRINAETSRNNSEKTRQSNETSRTNAESKRVSDENTRKNSEDKRNASESTRISNENTRQSNESTRINNENTRISSEKTRSNNETLREQSEQERKETFNSSMSIWEKNVTDIIERCDQVIEDSSNAESDRQDTLDGLVTEWETKTTKLIGDFEEFNTTANESEEQRVSAENTRQELFQNSIASWNNGVETVVSNCELAIENCINETTNCNKVATSFNNAEELRVLNEENRVTAEESRIQAESGRVDAENTRQAFFDESMESWENLINNSITELTELNSSCNNAEESRVLNEELRISAENNRILSEENRQTEFENSMLEWQGNIDEATERANLAAQECENIIELGVVLQTEKGVANGVAILDENTLIPITQINTQFEEQESSVIVSGETLNVMLGKIASYMELVNTLQEQITTLTEKVEVLENTNTTT